MRPGLALARALKASRRPGLESMPSNDYVGEVSMAPPAATTRHYRTSRQLQNEDIAPRMASNARVPLALDSFIGSRRRSDAGRLVSIHSASAVLVRFHLLGDLPSDYAFGRDSFDLSKRAFVGEEIVE